MVLGTGCSQKMGMTTLVLIDSDDPASEMAEHYLLPYLDHFGIDYEVTDIHEMKPGKNLRDYALVIIGHDMKMPDKADALIKKITKGGAGVLSFDPDWPSKVDMSGEPSDTAEFLTFDTSHYITALHPRGDSIRCFHAITIPASMQTGMKPVVLAGSRPLILVSEKGQPRRVTFTSTDWMKTYFLGPVMGLDDCLWRAMVWASRKPFVMRGLPPLVTMRVDDVAGRGELWGRSPLYWVNTAVKNGFKPWLGLFIYNLNPRAVDELRSYIMNNEATAAPHALGRPNRSGIKQLQMKNYTVVPGQDSYAGFYYNPDAIPLRETEYDEFIYFEHQKAKPWSDVEAQRGLDAVDHWYAANKPLPMSKYFIAHWYEMGSNIIPHIADKWGIEYLAMNKSIDLPYTDSVPWIKGGPFRLYEDPGTSTNNPDLRGRNPVYYSDFVNIDGRRFFNCFTEIRDVAGYEWAPDNNTKESAARGVTELRRALSGMDLAVLFTHETDYIYLINPESWEEQMKIIAMGIRDFNPMMTTMDKAVKIVRAHKTSRYEKGVYDPSDGKVTISLSGSTDTLTFLYLFEEKGNRIEQKLIQIPEFRDQLQMSIDILKDTAQK